MSKRVQALLLAAAAAGCAAPRVGPADETLEVQAAGSGADAASAKQAARRAALEQAVSLYVSTESIVSHAAVIQTDVYQKPEAFVAAERLSARRRGGSASAEGVFDLRYRALGQALDKLGLVAPEGVQGRPRLLLALTERGLACAAGAQRLKARLDDGGFFPMSFHENGGEALPSAARRLGAAVVISGDCAVALSTSTSAGLRSAEARLDLTVGYGAPKPISAGVAQRAAAFELTGDDAAVRAAENAAEAAAGRVRSILAAGFVERDAVAVLVTSLGDARRFGEFAARARALPGVARVALDVIAGHDAKFKIWTERSSADELAAALVRMPGFRLSVRGTESSYRWVELDAGEAF